MLALFGPTGVGKTAVAVAVARLLATEGRRAVAISADALQVYEGLECLTGAPSQEQRAALDHRLVGIASISEDFSAGRFAKLAHAEIDAALAAGIIPIVVGGTGLYLRAALGQLELAPPPPAALRTGLEDRARDEGLGVLYEELRATAPEVARGIDATDRSRIVRAVELAQMNALPPPGRSSLWSAEMRRSTLLVGLTMERESLYRRIDTRVDAIVAAGAAEEVGRALAAGVSRTARSAVGFEELVEGDLDGMRRRSRNLAKRQLTWMRKLGGVTTIDVTSEAPGTTARRVRAMLVEREASLSEPAAGTGESPGSPCR